MMAGLMGSMPGDWVCAFCRVINGRHRNTCEKCGRFRSESEAR